MAEFIQAPKGTKDVLPTEVHKWHYIESILRSTAERFGYFEIRFPTIEHTELFERGVGDTTDIVQKEMYTFTDKGGRSITLRPEGTASVVRSFVEHGLKGQGLPFKCYYIAPNFRYEKPQAGRLREHHQFGVECFGSTLPCADAEVIGIADTYLKRLGITDITAHINSIGCPVCRKDYHEALGRYLSKYTDKLCETCLGRLEKNPMRILDCKSPVCHEITLEAPRSLDYLCEECATHFEGVKTYLTKMDISFVIDRDIVRGLDYYTKTVFEFISGRIGAQAAVCAGGRYDRLVEALGGQATPGLGFGSGIERLLMVMESLGLPFEAPHGMDLFIAGLGDKADMIVQCLVHRLRVLGISAERDVLARSLKAQMKYADKIGAAFSLVIGDDELLENAANLKNMKTGEFVKLDLDADKIAQFILSK